MLSTALRAASASSAAVRAAVVSSTRGMSTAGLKGFNEHELAVENLHFSKEDERLLRNLLTKVKKQAEVVDKPATVSAQAAEEAALHQIVGKYKISDADFKALLDWKHAHY